MDEPLDLLGTPRPALTTWLAELGVGERQGPRVFGGLHRLRRPLEQIADLGGHARTIRAASWLATAEITDVQTDDVTEKLALRLHDGSLIEAVLVPMPGGRTTLCVSSQVGCGMACAFCATGTLGLKRHLRAGEIVAQVQAAAAYAATRDRRVTRLVFMGMGEPLHHWPSTRDALRVLLDGHGMAFATEKITVSTVGLPDKMEQFAADFGGKVQLALSLHAGTDATRARIIPMARAVPISRLTEILRAWPLPGGRALMIEYVVLPGVNDTDEELDGVAEIVRGLRAVVNLIPFNPFAEAGFRSPTVDEVRSVADRLRVRGVMAPVRWPRGREANGACGQLALAHLKNAG